MEKLQSFYDDKFYDNQISGSIRSAEIVLRLLFDLYKPDSVVDIGCGRGAWLAVAESLGSKILKGFDGEWIDEGALLSKNIDFSSIDLEGDIAIEDRYDLAISLEVAEHLSESRAEPFICTLCKASNMVLFSAPIRGQGGTNHINEQWQSYWIDLFNNYGLTVRPNLEVNLGCPNRPISLDHFLDLSNVVQTQ